MEFDRLLDVLPVDAREIFPSESLLDHVPALILEMGSTFASLRGKRLPRTPRSSEKRLSWARFATLSKRHCIRCSEYQCLAACSWDSCWRNWKQRVRRRGHPMPCSWSHACIRPLTCLHRPPSKHSSGCTPKTITDQAERLDQFTRVAAHEWRQPLGVLQLSVHLLREAKVDPSHVDGMLATVDRNVRRLIELAQKLEALAACAAAAGTMLSFKRSQSAPSRRRLRDSWPRWPQQGASRYALATRKQC